MERLNRFAARVEIGGQMETVHVKNTGRCRELLVPGAEVWLSRSDNSSRKTKYDLIAVQKQSAFGQGGAASGDAGALFNIDSQAPNAVAGEWLERQGFDRIVAEYRFGRSRIDFFMERGGERWLLEVKGCTLERDGIGYFPDAPTERGAKHLRELTAAVSEGFHAAVAFVMQADGMTTVLPNRETDPAFAEALDAAEQAGVQILCLPCHVEPDRLEIVGNLRLAAEELPGNQKTL